MGKYVGVVREHPVVGRIGEAIINMDNVNYISVTDNYISFIGDSGIYVNKDSIKYLLELLDTNHLTEVEKKVVETEG